MKELVKLIHSKQENNEDNVITDRHIVLDRSMHLYGDTTFKNCDFKIAPHSGSRFILEEDASVTFENCRFAGTLAKPADGSSTHPAIITGQEDSSLTFIGCRIENADSFIKSDGAVILHGCEINYHGNAASGDEAYKPVCKDSHYSLYAEILTASRRSLAANNPVGALMCDFLSADGEEVEMTDCSVICETNGGYSVKLNMKHGVLRSCSLKNVYEIAADVLGNCAYENCVTISLQTEDGYNEVTECQFIECNEVCAVDADFSDCEFSGIRDGLVAENTTISRCTFRDMTPGGDGAIHIEKTLMEDCIFEDITLKNEFYLIDADNDSALDNCTFYKCRTTRNDLQLVSTGGYRGKLRKKWVEDNICSDCTGLDKVIHIESWET